MDQQMPMGKKCPCPHHKMIPLFIVLFGLVFFLGALGIMSDSTVMVTWPVIVMAVGLTKLFSYKCKCC